MRTPTLLCGLLFAACVGATPSRSGNQNENTLLADAGAAEAVPACTHAADDGSELLSNPGFESTANDPWFLNTWPAATAATLTATATVVHSGSAARAMSVTNLAAGGGAIVVQSISLTPGRSYHGSIWLRSDDNVQVQFMIRQPSAQYVAATYTQNIYYRVSASQTITVGGAWQQYDIVGGLPDDEGPSQFGISFKTAGNLWLDDASLHVQTEEFCVPSARVPANFFGVVVNNWNDYAADVWPSALGFDVLRLWDTTTRWLDIEPAAGSWNFAQRFDVDVAAATTHGEEVLYTMGMTPAWASSQPTQIPTVAQDGPAGSAAYPSSVTAWTDYITEVANRYGSQIKYWEVWNEADIGFYSGTSQQLVTLTNTACATLHGLRADYVVLSPNFTIDGLEQFDEFLSNGGGTCVDALAFHLYPGLTPENEVAVINAFKDIRARHGLQNKPLWNTEGATHCLDGAPNCHPLSDAETRSQVARAYLVMWSAGLAHFNWYAWDITNAYAWQSGQDNFAVALASADHASESAGGVAYATVKEWLVGATLVAKQIDASGNWILTLQRDGGYAGYIVWNPAETNMLSVPNAWGAKYLRELTGAARAPFASAQLAVSSVPVLLENQ